ncbi:MAG TPA: hypothetical protein VGN57_06235 [Pirellulaceae bacterium]|jgi:gas vesicle protein|nr:hypothetical protein [Pirellulaceae bacterium]
MSEPRTGDFGASCPTPKPSQAEGEANRTQPNAVQPPKPSKAEGEDFRQTTGGQGGGATLAGSYSAGSSGGSFGAGIGSGSPSGAMGSASNVGSASNPSVTRAASDAGREVKDAAQQMAGEASRQASHLASDARDAVASQAAQLQQKGARYVERQKDFLAEEVSHVSAAVRQAAQKLHEEGDDRVASYVDQAASGIEGVGSYLRDRDAGALCDDFESLARRRPEIVYGGLFLAGLGIARFLKASRRRPQMEYASDYDGTDRYYDDPDTYRDSTTGRNDPYYATAGYMASAVTTRYPETGGEENCNVF